MHVVDRLVRHARITWTNYQDLPSPPFLILFINSICNQKCEHCFYWRNLNRRDDLSKEEIFALSRSLGRVENLNLSGGEPFLRPEFGEICRHFIRQNKVRQIYVPTNGYFTDRTVQQITETLKEKDLDLFVAELSLDGLGEFHNKFRGRITRIVLPGIVERISRSGARLLVLLLPTKETLFYDAYRRDIGNASETYQQLVKTESQVKQQIEHLLRERKIAYLDMTPALSQAVMQHQPIYTTGWDDHPNAAGYRLIAAAVREEMARLGW